MGRRAPPTLQVGPGSIAGLEFQLKQWLGPTFVVHEVEKMADFIARTSDVTVATTFAKSVKSMVTVWVCVPLLVIVSEAVTVLPIGAPAGPAEKLEDVKVPPVAATEDDIRTKISIGSAGNRILFLFVMIPIFLDYDLLVHLTLSRFRGNQEGKPGMWADHCS